MSDEPEVKEHWRALVVGRADCCELLARLKEEYDTQHDEIERLRNRILELKAELAAQRRRIAAVA